MRTPIQHHYTLSKGDIKAPLYTGIVNGTYGFFRLAVNDTDYDVHLARSLNDNADINMCIGEGLENKGAHADFIFHIASDDGDQRNIVIHRNAIGVGKGLKFSDQLIGFIF